MLINELSGNTRAFAVACFDTNSLKELQDVCLDETDLKIWQITEQQHEAATRAALEEKLSCL